MPRLKRICWEGMQIEVPGDWDPVTLECKDNGGFCRMEDAERRERMNVKWNGIKGRFSLEKNFKSIVKAVEKGVRRRGRKAPDFQFDTQAAIPGVRKALRKYEHRTFAWTEGELSGWGVLLYSDQSQRATVVQVIGSRGSRKLSGQILGSFCDPQPGVNRRWEMHGVAFETGLSWSIASCRYDPRGVFRLDLTAGPRLHLTAMRWSLANVWLQDADMEKFLKGSFTKEVRRYRLVFEPCEFLGHQAATFERAGTSLYARSRAWVRKRVRIGAPHFLSGVAWHCEASNRIFVLTRRGDTDGALEEALAYGRTMRCCGAAVEQAAREPAAVERSNLAQEGEAPGRQDPN